MDLELLTEIVSRRFGIMYAELRREIEGLTDEALAWKPMQDTSSISTLVVHTLGSIGELLTVVRGSPIERDREAEFTIGSSLSMHELQSRIDKSQIAFKEAMTQITYEDLNRPRSRPHRNVTLPGLEWIFVTLLHASEHIGQIQMTKQGFLQSR
ncbi:MAG: DinB family protein [Actinobacteria bacterium]|nr:DinB family protein [Actinomycetota bacterium]